MLYEANLTDEQKSKLRKLVWSAASKGVIAFFVAAATELGKRFVERVVGDDDEEDDDEEPSA